MKELPLKKTQRALADKEIAACLGVSLAEAAHVYDVVLSAHNRLVVQGKGAALEQLAFEFVRDAVLPLFGQDAVYEKQNNSGESRGARSGRNPLDGIVIARARRTVLGVDTKWSGKQGGVDSQILPAELDGLRHRYKGWNCRLAYIKGDGRPFTESLLQRSDIVCVQLGDTASRRAFRDAVAAWLAV